jgi:phosphate:Na+ symporter
MSGAVKGLANVPEFTQLFTMFEHPVLGLLAGAVLTAIIQSSSASVGILQALAATGGVTFGACLPILMGQHIGTCVTAMISSVGTNKNAKRAAFVHLTFNVLAAILLLTVFSILRAIFKPAILAATASGFGIAVAHSAISIIGVAIFLPLSSLLEKIALTVIPDAKVPETFSELDERLLQTPQVALQRCRIMVGEMATAANDSIIGALSCLDNYTDAAAKAVREAEDMTDHYEDILGTYLVKLGSRQIGESNSAETTELLRLIGDIERIADHSVNILESAEELRSKELQFSDKAKDELAVLVAATQEILNLTMNAISTGDLTVAAKVEPLEEVIDDLKEALRTRHSIRLSQGNCSIETGFVWSDLLTNLERISDHCSNVAGCIIDTAHHNLNLHESIRATHESDAFFKEQFNLYKEQYKLA